MLRPVFRPSKANALASSSPGRVDRRSEWTTLVPHDQVLGACALEILTCTKKAGPAGLVKNHGHGWLRLWHNETHYVSLGFYPDESTTLDPEDRPGLRMPGMLLTPDKYDRIDWPRRSVRVPISQDQYRDLVAWIEDLQVRRFEGSLAFDLVDRNCVGFLVRAGARCGVEVEADQPLLGFLPLRPGVPGWLARWVRPVRARIYALGLALFGGCAKVDVQYVRDHSDAAPARRRISGIEPIFVRSRDLLRAVPFYHVRALQVWQDRVNGTARPEPADVADLRLQDGQA